LFHIKSDAEYIAEAHTNETRDYYKVTAEGAEANARLIAAAPDLLAAAEALLKRNGPHQTFMLAKAVAKAKGGE